MPVESSAKVRFWGDWAGSDCSIGEKGEDGALDAVKFAPPVEVIFAFASEGGIFICKEATIFSTAGK
jgi:hypothetical protein